MYEYGRVITAAGASWRTACSHPMKKFDYLLARRLVLGDPDLGLRMEDPNSGTFVSVESVGAVAELIGRFYKEQFGFDGRVFPSRGRPGKPETRGRSVCIEATVPSRATAPLPRLQAEAPTP